MKKSQQPAVDRDGIPSLADYTPPTEGEIGVQFWTNNAMIAAAFMIIVLLIIIAVVYGISMAASGSHPLVVRASAHQTASDTIVVTYEGGPDSGSLREIVATVSPGAGQRQVQKTGFRDSTEPPVIGTMLEFTGPFAGRDRVVVTGIFTGGRETVILDTVL